MFWPRRRVCETWVGDAGSPRTQSRERGKVRAELNPNSPPHRGGGSSRLPPVLTLKLTPKPPNRPKDEVVGAAVGSEPLARAGVGMNGSSRALEGGSWAPFAPLCLNYLIVYALIPNNVFCRSVSPFPGEFAGCLSGVSCTHLWEKPRS